MRLKMKSCIRLHMHTSKKWKNVKIEDAENVNKNGAFGRSAVTWLGSPLECSPRRKSPVITR